MREGGEKEQMLKIEDNRSRIRGRGEGVLAEEKSRGGGNVVTSIEQVKLLVTVTTAYTHDIIVANTYTATNDIPTNRAFTIPSKDMFSLYVATSTTHGKSVMCNSTSSYQQENIM